MILIKKRFKSYDFIPQNEFILCFQLINVLNNFYGHIWILF